MDRQSQEQQKEFISQFFPQEIGSDSSHRQMDMIPSMFYPNSSATQNQQNLPQQGMISNNNNNNNLNGQLNIDIGTMLGMHGVETQPNTQTQSQYHPPLLLEQQFKLAQLQHLQQIQTQIIQQQIAIITSQSVPLPEGNAEMLKEQALQFHGLPTPGPSTELRPQPRADYVSPMALQYGDNQHQNSFQHSGMNTSQSEIDQYSRGTASAPAHIVFRNSPSLPLSSELDFDVSPLTSPWLGAQQQTASRPHPNKRTASPSGDESSLGPSRKKHSPAIRPTIPSAGAKKLARISKSTTNTPILRSSHSRRGSVAGEVIGDTPSPVDIAMPPPAPPGLASSSSSSSMGVSSSNTSANVGGADLLLTPVTPASIMNLGRLGINSSLSPPRKGPKPDSKSKGTTRTKAQGEPMTRRRKSVGSVAASPSLKSILPAGNNIRSMLDPVQEPGVQYKKASHKDAEQKRRDSLKNAYDDLRILLPPIPLPSDENFPDDRLLPGALPPRGPPKAGGDGPNKAVSKLQLLMCGNDYIRQLKGRVDRRDEEIERLRMGLGRLRALVEEDEEARADLDDLMMEKDLDAVERMDGGSGTGLGADYEGDDDGEV